MAGPSRCGLGALCLLALSIVIAASSYPCEAGMIELDHNYMGAPLSLPPYNDVMDSPSPSGDPIFCVYPPPLSPPSPPRFSFPSPISYNSPPIPSPPSPPSSPPVPMPPTYSYPPIILPSPPAFQPSPTTPRYPPIYLPPVVFVPAPPLFQPPIVYPPPTAPPPPPVVGTGGGIGNDWWCIAKPSVPDPILQEALDYACDSGADCDSIQPAGSCFEPDLVLAHASFAFNSYWQRTKAAGGSCDFGGTAMLVTVDPSFDGCHFLRI